MSLAYHLFILFLYSYFEYFTYSYTCHVFIFHASHVFSMFLFFVRLHSMSLVYVFFIFRFYNLLHSSLSYLYYRILSCYRRSSCTFHILLSYTIPKVIYICTFLFYLSYTLCFCILSVLFLCLYTYFHIKSYCTSCSCNCLYFHRIARLCFSYHIILYTFHIHFLCVYFSFFFYIHVCKYLRSGFRK